MTKSIKAVCIQMKASLILGGYAVIVINHIKTIVDFDVVHDNNIPERVLVGGRGKKLPEQHIQVCEELLLDYFQQQVVPLNKGLYEVSA
ncbi:hypothetical protein ABE82_26805 (plasmid) [Paenibacillus peoriae]|uniref:hypothetical protein n=1 Tax=Paenibacillus peoriae TaxID=59893 RepID=UPI00071F7708|nr:hypothetical protein [Paenibacillus peoriae]ALS10019.1 hypothetical protein ABE82_26805 [Paenibacillus peoriae]